MKTRLLLLVLLSATFASCGFAEDWPAFLGPRGNSQSSEKGILKDWPKAGLKILWQAELGESYGSPTVSQGKLFHFDRHGKNARLTCRDARTGDIQWKKEYPTEYQDFYGYNNGPRSCPVVDDGCVYVYGVEGRLSCYQVSDGREVWSVDTAKDYNIHQNFFGVCASPVIEGDLLLAMVGGSPAGNRPDDFMKVQPNNSAIVAFDKKTGKERYRIGQDLASYATPTVATIGGRRWAFSFGRAGLLAFEPKTGKEEFFFPWRAKFLESVNASNPVVVRDEVLITEAYQLGSALLKVTPGKYQVVWSDENKGRDKSLRCHWNTPVEIDGYAYGSSGRHESEAELRCIDWKTGEVQWTKRGLARCSLTVIDGHLLCFSETGLLELLKINPKQYDPVTRWDTQLAEPCWAGPVVANGVLYLRGRDRLIACQLIP